MTDAFIAADFGGGSGRVMAGIIGTDNRLTIRELHRFPNRRVILGPHEYWNFPALYAEMLHGLRVAADSGLRIRSIGIDTWGVDFGLIDRRGALLGLPVCYRDPAIAGAVKRHFTAQQLDSQYAAAGIQVMDINTIYRLMDMRDEKPELLDCTGSILFTPDLFSYFLTGKANCEYTIASTSGLLDAAGRAWNNALIDECRLPRHIFPPIVMPGTVRGTITAEVNREIGTDYEIPVVAVGSHDTASAVFSVADTYDTTRTAYLSSGTWSLLGVALDRPVLTPEARALGFTNEGGVDGKIRLLQNITGLWILQNLVAQWCAESGKKAPDYDRLISEARASHFESTIDVDDPRFHSARNMGAEIATSLKERGLTAPASQGDFVRCVLRSLADRYRRGIEAMNSILPAPVRKLRIIGGGSRNALLNELTSEATGLPVEAGPAEATAIGNILLQARTMGRIASPADITSIDMTDK